MNHQFQSVSQVVNGTRLPDVCLVILSAMVAN